MNSIKRGKHKIKQRFIIEFGSCLFVYVQSNFRILVHAGLLGGRFHVTIILTFKNRRLPKATISCPRSQWICVRANLNFCIQIYLQKQKVHANCYSQIFRDLENIGGQKSYDTVPLNKKKYKKKIIFKNQVQNQNKFKEFFLYYLSSNMSLYFYVICLYLLLRLFNDTFLYCWQISFSLSMFVIPLICKIKITLTKIAS